MVSSRLDYCKSLSCMAHLHPPQQTTAHAERPSTHRHDDEKTRSHNIGVSQPALAPCECSHSVKNIALLTFKALTTHQPSYSDDLLQQHHSSRQLRSSGHNLLEIPRMRTGFAQRSFTYTVLHTFGTLPRDIIGNLNVTANTFKKKL